MGKEKEEIITYMTKKLSELSEDYYGSTRIKALALLRRGIGKVPGEMPELWGIIFADMPETMMGKFGTPTKAEWSVYTALTLYAMHQQGIESSMHERNVRVGRAISSLVNGEEDRPRVARRFNEFATSADIKEASTHLRGLIQLLRSKNQALDYVLLACDLYDYQWDEESRNNVKLRWAQDFYSKQNENKNE